MALVGKKTVRSAIGGLIAVAIALLAYEVFHWFTHVYESQARVRTDLTKMSSRVDGTIARIHVQEGDRVSAGDLLVTLADDDIRLNVSALGADLSLEEANRARLASERDAYRVELASKLATGRQRVRAGEVEHRAIEDRLRLAERDLERVKVLFSKALTSEKDLAVEQDRVLILRGDLSRSAASIEIARREVEQVAATEKQLDVIADRIRISEITTRRIRTMIEREEVSLGFRHVRSPIDGVIDRVYKHLGEYVEEGEPILILHDEKLLWIEANIDEDQIRHVRVGQEVLIHLEAYPFEEFLGEVRRIGSATAVEMGIGGNARSQFGRAAERVPVEIALRAPPPDLAPGMLASVNVRIYDAVKLRSLRSFL